MSVTELDLLPAGEVCPNLFCQTTLPLLMSPPTLSSWLIGRPFVLLQITVSLASIFFSPIILEAVLPFLFHSSLQFVTTFHHHLTSKFLHQLPCVFGCLVWLPIIADLYIECAKQWPWKNSVSWWQHPSRLCSVFRHQSSRNTQSCTFSYDPCCFVEKFLLCFSSSLPLLTSSFPFFHCTT